MKKLCIVVPYRDREKHLNEFIPHIKKTLEYQKIDYSIIVVEQTFDKPFNRAKLLNIGFDYTKGKYDYYCFHDVDMLPVESDYEFCEIPTHLASRAEQFGWNLPYDGYFGGVTIFSAESFKLINGYSNEYWGWGAEDDDVYRRVVLKGMNPRRKNCSFRSLSHDRIINRDEYDKNIEYLHAHAESKINEDGLNTLSYSVLDSKILDDYEIIKVSL